MYLVLVAPNSIAMTSSIIDFALFSFIDEVEGLPTFETVGVDGGGVKVELKRQINIVNLFYLTTYPKKCLSLFYTQESIYVI